MADGGDDWRARVRCTGEGPVRRLLDALGGPEVAKLARQDVPQGVTLSQDDETVFVYADTQETVEAASAIVRRVATEHGLEVQDVLVSHWHPDEEQWEDASVALPATDADHAREREALDDRERAESRSHPAADWEVDVRLPDRETAVSYAAALTGEGIPNRRSFSTLRIAAETEADARAVIDRITPTAPAGAEISGPLGSEAEASQTFHPFSFLGGLGG